MRDRVAGGARRDGQACFARPHAWESLCMKRRLQSHVQPVPESHQSGAHSRAPRRTRGSPDQLPRSGLLDRETTLSEYAVQATTGVANANEPDEGRSRQSSFRLELRRAAFPFEYGFRQLSL